MFACFSQKDFQEDLKSWQEKYNLGTDKRKNQYCYNNLRMICRLNVLNLSLKSKKANTEKSIEHILELCVHPDWGVPKSLSFFQCIMEEKQP